MAVKDEVDVAGQPCTEGSLICKDVVADHTAACIQRIIDAGGIIHARSATPEFCCAAITDSRLWGTTRNPWNTALARAAPPEARGRPRRRHDGARHRFGHRRLDPHPGLLLRRGGLQAALRPRPQDPPFNLDHYCHDGPMARTVEDCRLLENVMAGPHRDDIVSLRPKLTIPRSCRASKAGGSP